MLLPQRPPPPRRRDPESYALERAMLGRGWPTVRMSGGDFKVLLRLADGRTCYVDVFVAFYSDGVFYQLGNRSGRLPRAAVTPTSTIVLEGVELPAPADPEAMLAFVYGPSWRVPDPSFQVRRPARGRASPRRLAAWLPRRPPGVERAVPRLRVDDVPKRRSDFARWAARRIGRDDIVVEIGSGTGRDAAFFARRGHPVRAYDVSPEARTRTPEAAAQVGPDVRRTQADAGGAPHRRRQRRRDRDDPGPPSPLRARRRRLPRRRGPSQPVAAVADGSARHRRPAVPGVRDDHVDRLARRPRADRARASRRRRRGGGQDRGVRRSRRPACRRPRHGPVRRTPPSTCRLQVTFPRTGATTRCLSLTNAARRTADRVRAARGAGVRARLRDLEAEVQENRRLNRRVAELTDLVAELVVPLARRDDAEVEELLARYRSLI